MITTVVDDVDTAFFAFSKPTEILSLVFYAQYPDVYRQDQQEISEILFGTVDHYLVNISARRQLYLSFHYGLHWMIFGIGSIYGGICLQSGYEIVTVILGLGQHGYVAGMEKIERRKCYAHFLAFIFEPADVIEYHDTSLRPPPMSRLCV